MQLVYLTAAWLAGIALAQSTNAPLWLWGVIGGLALIGLVLARHFRRWSLAFGCALLFAMGAARLALAVPHLGEDNLASYNDRGFVTIEGLIVDAPEERDTTVNLRVRAEMITLPDGEQRAVEGTALVEAPRVGTYRYGDPVRVRGDLRTPPVLGDFSYRDSLAREGIYSLMRYTEITITGPRRGNPVRAMLLDFRDATHQAIVRLLPDPQASLLAGILLGIESGISPDVRAAFNAVGATHIIVISGSNLAILAGLIQNVARRFVREGWAAVITIVSVVTYTLFVGGDSAVVRAAIMTILGLIATRLGRQTYGLASLSFAALLMTAINPYTLWSVSFQLSFLATLGLILYVEPLQAMLAQGLSKLLAAERARQIVAATSDAFVVTVAAQIATTPIMAYYFGRFSFLSLPVNFLIIPAQTPVMVLGGLGVLISLVMWPIGQALSWGSWLFLSYTWAIVENAARLPFASLGTGDIAPLAIWGIYGLMLALTVIAKTERGQRIKWRDWLRQALSIKLIAGTGLLLAALLAVAAMALPDGRLHITFIDVGAGTATLIETPSGRQILVDGGGSGRRLSAALGSSLPFWDKRLDLLVITQPTERHISGLVDVLERYRFDAVMTNGIWPDTQNIRALHERLAGQGTPEVVAYPGMRVSVGDGVTLEVLYSQTTQPLDDETSPGEPVVIRLRYGDLRVLLTGDLSSEGETSLLNSGVQLSASVLQVARSGDEATTSEAFLMAVRPQIAVLPVEAGNRYGLPDAETLARLQATGVTLYRTDQAGTIRLVSDGVHLWIRADR
jgi:competence protein ComEC